MTIRASQGGSNPSWPYDLTAVSVDLVSALHQGWGPRELMTLAALLAIIALVRAAGDGGE